MRTAARLLRTSFKRETADYPDFYHRYSHDIAHVFGLQIFGIKAVGREVGFRKRLLILNVIVILSPVLLAAKAANVSSYSELYKNESFFWASYFLILTILVQGFSYAGVRIFHNLTPQLERDLSRKGCEEYERWAAKSTAWGSQALFAAFCVALGIISLWAISNDEAINHILRISWTSYLSMIVSGIYLSGGVWWTLQGPRLAWVLCRPGCFRLNSYSPASTPAVELLVRCFRISFLGACIGASACLVPVSYWFFLRPESTMTLMVAVGAVLLTSICLVAISLIPEWQLSKIIIDRRHQVLNALSRKLPHDPFEASKLTENDHFFLNWMQMLSASPKGTLSESVIISTVTAFSSAAMPVLIQYFIMK